MSEELKKERQSIFQTAPEHEVREYAKRLKGCLSGLTAGINGHIAKDLGIYDEWLSASALLQSIDSVEENS